MGRTNAVRMLLAVAMLITCEFSAWGGPSTLIGAGAHPRDGSVGELRCGYRACRRHGTGRFPSHSHSIARRCGAVHVLM